MKFFTSGLFWFIEGVFACLVAIGLKIWTEERSIPMPWWKWILCFIWLGLAGFTLAFIGTSLGEGESHAALMGLIVFGVATVIMGVGFWRLLGFSFSKKETLNADE